VYDHFMAFPAVAEQAGTYAFAFFGTMMICQIFFAVRWMPETKGGTIEDIEHRLGITPGHTHVKEA
jgi:hypothetical protein